MILGYYGDMVMALDMTVHTEIPEMHAFGAIPFPVGPAARVQRRGTAQGARSADIGSLAEPFRSHCVAPGTLIDTVRGPVAAGHLRPGDDLLTRNRDLRRIRWIGHIRFKAASRLVDGACPIRIGAGVLGDEFPRRDLFVSPEQAVLVSSRAVEQICGQSEAFVRAADLLHVPGVGVVRATWAVYVCILLDAHEVLTAEGVGIGSFRPQPEMTRCFPSPLKESLFGAAPALRYAAGSAAYVAARPSLNAREARLVL